MSVKEEIQTISVITSKFYTAITVIEHRRQFEQQIASCEQKGPWNKLVVIIKLYV